MPDIECLYQQAIALQAQGRYADAQQHYQLLLQHNPRHQETYLQLCHLLFQTGQISEAEALCRQAIAQNIHHPSIYQIFGKIYRQQRQFEGAISAYSQALSYHPNHPGLLQELGLTYREQSDIMAMQAAFYLGCGAYRDRNYAEAIAQLQKFLNSSSTKDVAAETIRGAAIKLADCFERLNRYDDAIQTYKTCLEFSPTPELFENWIAQLRKIGRIEAAIALATDASQQFPENLSLHSAKYWVPILYDNSSQIESYRRRFTQGLSELLQTAAKLAVKNPQSVLDWLTSHTNFYLQYQGYNDINIQKQYGQFLHEFFCQFYPQWTEPLPIPSVGEGEKIRVGYISACFWSHTVGKLFCGWVKHHDRDRFEVSCYSISDYFDNWSQEYRQHSDNFYQFQLTGDAETNLKTVAEKIRSDRLHVLVYLDMGMHAFLSALGGLRLAPVQCLTWGHPVTSGLPTMDYFLSSQLMEPLDAIAHYSERLVLLPNLSICYPQPRFGSPTTSRAAFQLRESAVVYLSCQSLFKYLPQHDHIFAEIARQVPEAQFAFISRLTPPMTEKFRDRLQRAFANVGLDSDRYCVILPEQDAENYGNLNLLSDIFLDTFGWSGGKTTLEAIACDLPIVTCPGKFMRSRHAYAMLHRLQIQETIAKTERDYIYIAVKLGLNPAWRRQIVEKIEQRRAKLYDDRRCVVALESFYRHVATHPQHSVPTP